MSFGDFTPRPNRGGGRGRRGQYNRPRGGGYNRTYDNNRYNQRPYQQPTQHVSPDRATQEVKSQEVRSHDAKSQKPQSPDVRSQKVKAQGARSSEVKSQDARVQEVKSQDARVQEVKSQDARVQEVKSQDVRNDSNFIDRLVYIVFYYAVIGCSVKTFLNGTDKDFYHIFHLTNLNTEN